VGDALEFSMSALTDAVYLSAEGIFRPLSLAATCRKQVPPWALTWPGGQLTGIGRNGRFAENIGRYEAVFERGFKEEGESVNVLRARAASEAAAKAATFGERGARRGEREGGEGGGGRRTKYVDIVNLADLNDARELGELLKGVSKRLGLGRGTPEAALKRDMAIDFYAERAVARKVVRNAGAGGGVEVTPAEVARLKMHFVGERERVERLAGRPMKGWGNN
jgi:hypothetical protein